MSRAKCPARVVSLVFAGALCGVVPPNARLGVPSAQQGTDCRLTGIVTVDGANPIPGIHLKLEYVPQTSEPSSGVGGDRSNEGPPDELPPPPARPLGFLPAPGSPPSEGDTDGSGRFLFERLQPGRYRLSVVAPSGYVFPDRMRWLNLRAGESRSLVLRLDRAGALTGRLLAGGKGFASGSVRLLQWSGALGGPRRLVPAFSPNGVLSVTTGPNGEFGFVDIPPGEYFLVGGYDERRFFNEIRSRPGYVPTYYPGTTKLVEAHPATVRAGETTARVDFTVMRAKRSTISVTAVDSRGRPLPGGVMGHVGLRPASDARAASVNAYVQTTRPGASPGKFELREVVAADYYLTASLMSEQDPGNGQTARIRTGDGRWLWEAESAYIPISVKEGEDVKLAISTNPGATVSGRVVVEGASEGGGFARTGVATVTARSVGYVQMGMPPSARITADGTFTLTGLHGSVVLSAQERGVIKSITIAGQDVTGRPLEFKGTERITDLVMTLTTGLATIRGVVDAVGADGVFVVAFPDNAARCLPGTVWMRMLRLDPLNRPPAEPASARIERSTTADAPISFALGQMLPGRYLVAAVADRGQAPVFDAEMLDRLRPLATTVTLAAGETGKVELRVVSPAPR